MTTTRNLTDRASRAKASLEARSFNPERATGVEYADYLRAREADRGAVLTLTELASLPPGRDFDGPTGRATRRVMKQINARAAIRERWGLPRADCLLESRNCRCLSMSIDELLDSEKLTKRRVVTRARRLHPPAVKAPPLPALAHPVVREPEVETAAPSDDQVPPEPEPVLPTPRREPVFTHRRLMAGFEWAGEAERRKWASTYGIEDRIF